LAASDFSWARMAARDDLHCTSSRLGKVLCRLGETGGLGSRLGKIALV